MPLVISERLKLLKEISTRLSWEEYYLIDTTLKAFGLPTSTSWSGDKTAYVLEMTSKATDLVLIEIGKHLDFELPNATTNPVPEENLIDNPHFWQNRMFKLFVSHLATEREFAGELQRKLLKYSISCFVAHNDIAPTKEWQDEIKAGLQTCDSLVALFHKGFHESKWTDQEIGFVMGRNCPTFAIRLGETPYGFIGRFQAFNGLGKDAKQIAKELFEAYSKNPLTRPKIAGACVYAFENSSSYEQAKQNTTNLEAIGTFDDSLCERISDALQKNTQISGAFGVSARVKTLLFVNGAKFPVKWPGA